MTYNNDGTASISGNPATGTEGVYEFAIYANSSSGTDAQDFTLTVLEGSGFTIFLPLILK